VSCTLLLCFALAHAMGMGHGPHRELVSTGSPSEAGAASRCSLVLVGPMIAIREHRQLLAVQSLVSQVLLSRCCHLATRSPWPSDVAVGALPHVTAVGQAR
jgi:hypothetical protein